MDQYQAHSYSSSKPLETAGSLEMQQAVGSEDGDKIIDSSSSTKPQSVGNPSTALNNTHSSTCDRRLSRAARSLLIRHLQSILSLVYPDDNYNDGISISTTSVWQLLERSLAPHAYSITSNKNGGNSNHKCPLIPSKDMLRHHEEQSILLQPPPPKASSRHGISIRSSLYKLSKRAWQDNTLYRCGLCGKMFSSQYYLDQHLEHQHSHQLLSDQNNNNNENNDNNLEMLICPATEWCPGLPSCAQRALELEPYYGTGSGGLGNYDRHAVHRSLWKEAHPELYDTACDEDQMRAQKYKCQQMMRDCFSSVEDGDDTTGEHQRQREIHRQLEQSLCDPISCPDRLHQLFFAATAKSNDATAMMMKHMHEWQDDWEGYYYQHHGLGRTGMALLVILGIWYGGYLYQTNNRNGSKWLRHSNHNNKKGSRLLQKGGGTKRTSIFGMVPSGKRAMQSLKAKLQ